MRKVVVVTSLFFFLFRIQFERLKHRGNVRASCFHEYEVSCEVDYRLQRPRDTDRKRCCKNCSQRKFSMVVVVKRKVCRFYDLSRYNGSVSRIFRQTWAHDTWGCTRNNAWLVSRRTSGVVGNLKYSKTEHWQHCHESSKDYIVSSHGTNAPDCTIPCVELNIQTTYASFFILFISFYPFFQYVYNGTCNVDKKESLRFRDRSSIFRTYANESIMFILACKVELSRITNNRNHKTSYYDGLNGECVYYERLSVYWKCMLIREHISPWKNKLHEYLNSSVVELFFFFLLLLYEYFTKKYFVF